MIDSIELNLWRTFLERCLASRLETDRFSKYVILLYQRSPLLSSQICSIFLSPILQNNYCIDPKSIRYIICLLGLGYVDIPNILNALWDYSTCRTIATQISPEEEKNAWVNSFTAEETIFYRLAKAISSGSVPRMTREAVDTVRACTQWMEGAILASRSQHELPTLVPSQIAEMNAQNMALGTLVVSIVESSIVQNTIAQGHLSAKLRKSLRESLSGIVSLMIFQNSPQGAARLEVFRTETLLAIEPKQKELKNNVDKEIKDIIDEGLEEMISVDNMIVNEIVKVNTRAGLYVLFNSMLVGRPLIDDNTILTFLQNRYRNDLQTSIIDLILAAFDTLANATIRNEKYQTKTLLRSFLVNKLPLILNSLCSQLFPPLTSEFCITQALNQVDTTNFPTLSTMFDEASGNNLFPESVRQDFCFACCLHGLLAESSIEKLLGDVPIQSLPAEGKYLKRNLVKIFLSDVERAEKMIDDLENMDGNVGAISTAIVEVISKLCSNKETMALKTLCCRLVRKPSSLDVLLLFDKPNTILQPICDLLDNWRYDEDQGEYQPVYEEFGIILLLLLSFVNRYSLTSVCLGYRQPGSFVLKILQAPYVSLAHPPSPKTQSHLNNWLLGLFSPENSGLTDDLMSSCPPQEFYLLVPTLFHNIVHACATQNLTTAMLSSGLEYLVDTFLLPSLVPGISFLSAYLWENRGDKDAVIQILTALITTPLSNKNGNNTDAAQILGVVLDITAKELEQSLRWLQRVDPLRQDIEPLSKALRCNLGWERSAASEHTELENWTSTPGGGLSMAIKQTLRNLLQWHLQPTDNPANYTHRQILVGIKMLGAKRVIGIILEDLRAGISTGHAGAALDVASSIVCAADALTWDSIHCSNAVKGSGNGEGQTLQRRLNLREALKNEVENAPKLQKTDSFAAETVVRLYRNVESLLATDNNGTRPFLANAAEIDVSGDINDLNPSNDNGIVEGISRMQGLDDIGDLEMGNIDHFEGLSERISNVNGFGTENVNLITENRYLGMGGNQGNLLDGIKF
ncbi:Mediator of RNA polymerase II transcription subunit 5 [Erysiphe neolycopersici]|uniref:Mediator of RNA polymerase II transcription subunit 5 n=1 Tax=Erysiphe neolycopersici TaxID=212602 RepID=A0A420HRG4_9PEZI|nr:Mediator of RNA polymerase II transcription subunit 5 [Erysiphe neolycopersici]